MDTAGWTSRPPRVRRSPRGDPEPSGQRCDPRASQAFLVLVAKTLCSLCTRASDLTEQEPIHSASFNQPRLPFWEVIYFGVFCLFANNLMKTPFFFFLSETKKETVTHVPPTHLKSSKHFFYIQRFCLHGTLRDCPGHPRLCLHRSALDRPQEEAD